MKPKEFTTASLKRQWVFGPPTKETPCGGCKHLTNVQGYFYTCRSPEYKSCYYGFLGNTDAISGLKSCWEQRTSKARNINPHNPLGE